MSSGKSRRFSKQIEGSSDWGRYPNLIPDLSIATYTVHPHMNMYTHMHQTYTHTHSPTKHANYRELWKGVGRGATGMSVKCSPGVCGLEADPIRFIKNNCRCKFALKWTSWHVIAEDKRQEFVLSQPSGYQHYKELTEELGPVPDLQILTVDFKCLFDVHTGI